MMRRCINLSRFATTQGEFPFAAIVTRAGAPVAETTNRVRRDGDVTRHAEVLAVSEAQRVLGAKNLDDCTLYTTVEPCPMCSFPIRETRIARVVCAIRSPLMGGFSKWNVLADKELSNVMPEAFGAAPEVLIGVLAKEAEQVWRNWNPVIWGIIRYRGCLGGEAGHESCVHLPAAPRRRHFLGRLLALHH